MVLEVVDTLRNLVQIPSVNPMGRELSGPEFFEYGVTDHLEKLFDDLGLPWQRQEISPLRTNILARVDGQVLPEDGGPLLLFEVHQDTVPVEGMTIEPWTPTVKEDRVFGRGSCDVKGGMASMLTALSRLAEERPPNMPTIVLACTIDEEHGFTGATQLVNLWTTGKSKLLPRAPDGVVVAEPTTLDVVVAHKGVARWRCHTHGRATHSSQPDQGKSAIYQMARLLQTIETYANDVVPTLGKHARVGRPTMSVGLINGGISVNTVPDLCTIEIDRRVLPGEDPQSAYDHAVAYINEHCGLDEMPEHEPPNTLGLGLADHHNGPLGEQVGKIANELYGAGKILGVQYGTDAAVFAAAGVPTVVFGPGSINQAHTIDEWVAIDQLEKAAEVYYQLGKSFTGQALA